jgi:pyruvate dehydrogenase E1 component alpha subunit
MSDPAKYRTEDELAERKKRDPVLLARERLLADGMTEDELMDVEDEVDTEIKDAVKFADQAALATEQIMHDSVMAQGDLK